MNDEYKQFAEIAEKIKSRYLDDVNEWAGSPFKWIKDYPIKKIGQIGEDIVSNFLRDKDFSVLDAPGSEADKIVNGKRVEIKFATLSKDGKYIFNQIRDQKYDILLCVGVSPMDAHGWVSPKNNINNGDFPTESRDSVRGRYSFGLQHGGDEGDGNTWQLSLTVPHSPPWMKPQNGKLSAMYEELRKLTGG